MKTTTPKTSRQEQCKRYYEANKERLKAASLEYYNTHKKRALSPEYSEKRRQYRARMKKEHPEQWKEDKRRHRQKSIDRKTEFVNQYKLQHPCKRCGEADPVVLCFHHVDPSTKKTEVSQIMQKLAGMSILKKEIEKCIVLCFNCHARLHHEEKEKAAG